MRCSTPLSTRSLSFVLVFSPPRAQSVSLRSHPFVFNAAALRRLPGVFASGVTSPDTLRSALAPAGIPLSELSDAGALCKRVQDALLVSCTDSVDALSACDLLRILAGAAFVAALGAAGLDITQSGVQQRHDAKNPRKWLDGVLNKCSDPAAAATLGAAADTLVGAGLVEYLTLRNHVRTYRVDLGRAGVELKKDSPRVTPTTLEGHVVKAVDIWQEALEACDAGPIAGLSAASMDFEVWRDWVEVGWPASKAAFDAALLQPGVTLAQLKSRWRKRNTQNLWAGKNPSQELLDHVNDAKKYTGKKKKRSEASLLQAAAAGETKRVKK
jgi:hypothetical protein